MFGVSVVLSGLTSCLMCVTSLYLLKWTCSLVDKGVFVSSRWAISFFRLSLSLSKLSVRNLRQVVGILYAFLGGNQSKFQQ